MKNTKEKMLVFLVLLFGFYIRTFYLDTPLLDAHSWRQTQTAMFARNFYRHGYNILLPQCDWAGKKPGYIESEFQLYPYIVAILYKFFGIKESLGKLVSILFSTFSMYFLFLLARRFFDFTTSMYALLFFILSPLNIFFSRTFMPEATMIFFSISAIYFFVMWIETEHNKYFYLSSIMCALAFLVKIPTLYISFPLFYLALCKFSWRAFINKKLYLFLLIVILPSILWYGYAYQLGKMSGLTENIWSIGEDKWGNLSVWQDTTFYTIILGRIYYLILTPVLVPFAILGLLLKSNKKIEYLFYFWILGIILYFFAAAVGNKVHSYYQLPIIPPLSIFVAKGISFFSKKEIAEKFFNKKISLYFISIILISFVCLSYFSIKPAYNIIWPFYYSAQDVKKISDKKDLILVADRSYPEVLYYSDRKGYHINPWETEPSVIESYKDVKYLVMVYSSIQYLPPTWQEFLKESNKIKETQNYTIVKLR